GLFYRQDAIVQAPSTARVAGERQDFQERGQAFLSRGDTRRTLGQPARYGLTLTVQAGRYVSPALVHLQNAHVATTEARTLSDLDVVATCRRIGHDAVVEDDPD